jgi:LacI family transcriptional regulator
VAKLKDVARLARVDPSTASRVLRGDPRQAARSETRQRILRAATELGYRPNSLARGLRLRRTHTIALLVPDLNNVGFAEITHGVQEAAEENGYLLMLSGAHRPVGEGQYPELLLEGRVDGLLVAFAHLDDPLVGRLADLNLPLVLVNRRAGGAPCSVIVDDEWGSRLAVEYLVSLGHREVGHVTGSLETDTGLRRERGFMGALAQAHLSLDQRWVAEGRYTEEGGEAAARRILERSGRELPSALYVANLMSALGVLTALRAAGLQVPDDMSVITMDDHVVAAHTAPPLTSVRMPFYKMGVEAVRMLIDAIEGRPVGHRVVDEAPRVIVRESTAPAFPFRSRTAQT